MQDFKEVFGEPTGLGDLDTSYLGRLPVEVRLKIWGDVLAGSQLDITVGWTQPKQDTFRWFPSDMAYKPSDHSRFLLAYNGIAAEAMDIFWTRTDCVLGGIGHRNALEWQSTWNVYGCCDCEVNQDPGACDGPQEWFRRLRTPQFEDFVATIHQSVACRITRLRGLRIQARQDARRGLLNQLWKHTAQFPELRMLEFYEYHNWWAKKLDGSLEACHYNLRDSDGQPIQAPSGKQVHNRAVWKIERVAEEHTRYCNPHSLHQRGSASGVSLLSGVVPYVFGATELIPPDAVDNWQSYTASRKRWGDRPGWTVKTYLYEHYCGQHKVMATTDIG